MREFNVILDSIIGRNVMIDSHLSYYQIRINNYKILGKNNMPFSYRNVIY